MTSDPPILSKQICSTPSCGKAVTARGYCVACYYRKLRHGNLEPGSQTKRWKHRLSKIDEVSKTAVCAHCGEVKIIRRGANSKQWRCSTDANYRSREYKKAYRQDKKSQLTDHCEICDTKENLCWDHNHQTGLFRGTLCSNCNKAIGLFLDNPALCIKASEYLVGKSEQSS